MSLLDAHEQELETASRDLALRPLPAPAPERKFNAWRATAAAPRGTAAGAAESAGFFADILGAFGQTLATTPLSNTGGMFSVPDAKAQREQDEARTKLITQGQDFSSEAGDLFRGVARGYRPDAKTAHVAEELVFGAARVVSKAVGYSLAGGPVVGAALTGADEGMQVADDLRLQGVDLETRTMAGAVQGAGTAVGVALPVAGKTLAQTLALVAAGGPGTFVAQQAATREILQSAGYEEAGAQFDPFDPVGLAVATLLPAAFGAYGLRRARAAEALPIAPETVDAARVSLAAEQAQGTRLTSAADLPARAAEDMAIARADEQLAAGERVEVGALPRIDPEQGQLGEFAARVQEEVQATLDVAAKAERAERAQVQQDAAAQQAVAEPAATSSTTPDSAAAPDRMAQLTERYGDMQVQIDGMDAPVTVRELLAGVKAEAEVDVANAPLLQLAAECAVTG